MPQSSHRDDFFQTEFVNPSAAFSFILTASSASIQDSDRKIAKSKNEHGSPIRLQSKILAVAADPFSAQAVFVAESAGTIRKVSLEVGRQARHIEGAGLD
jgi:hypothetical protein